ncbi:hypothetical protein [Paenibacillus sp. HB172176]|uniref:hypothetical protein n=1 Tax=Paenibacillus sp. HB172176 TaxID=2493690 RepID=UPI001438E411|nr:hypothetical protein [Paenibacillus sp. HB172176]
MKNEEKMKDQTSSRLFTSEGKPVRVLSTSLGLALLANIVMASGAYAEGNGGNSTSTGEPKLVEWSNEEVKQYFDKNVDWSLPIEKAVNPEDDEESAEQGSSGASAGDTGGTTVINHYGGGFGWTDLMLYHLLFNSGGSYSSSRYYTNRPAYNTSTNTSYKPKSYTSDTFQNKQVAGTNVRPKTSTSTGSVTRRATSSGQGSIGGNSSSKSSSGSSSKSSSGSSSKSSGFGG